MINAHLPVVAIICHGEFRADEHNLAVQQEHSAVETYTPAAVQAWLRKQSLDAGFLCQFCDCLAICASGFLVLVLNFVIIWGFCMSCLVSWCLQVWATV